MKYLHQAGSFPTSKLVKILLKGHEKSEETSLIPWICKKKNKKQTNEQTKKNPKQTHKTLG